MATLLNASRWRSGLSVVAAAFGVATIVSGGRVLFGSTHARAAEGAYIDFVVAFNFAAGFAYIAAAAGLALGRSWSVRLAKLLAGATVAVFAAVAVHVAAGGAHEQRTIVAMTVRALFWIAFASVGARLLPRPVVHDHGV